MRSASTSNGSAAWWTTSLWPGGSLRRLKPRICEGCRLNGSRSASSRYWTLKESYIKARGLGLALPLDQFAFTIPTTDSRISFMSAVGDERRWRFASVAAPSGYLIAVGAETGGAALNLRAQAFSPAHLSRRTREHR